VAGNYNLGTAEGLIRIKYDGTGSKQAQQDFDKVDSKAKKSAGSLTDAGNKAAVAGGLLAAGLGYATTKAIDFEKQISAIGAVSGATNRDLEALRAKALQLGSDTSFSASQAAQAMEELAKAGVSTRDILNGAADATVALAAAGGVDLPTAAGIAANAMNLFGLTAKELPKVVDQIAGAANNSAIDVTDFGFSLAQVGAVAKLSGLSFQDTATAITAMGNAGIKGSDAGTSLKSFLQNLIPTTKQQIELSKQLGLVTKDGKNQFFDQSGAVKSLADVSGVLQNALKGMSKEQQLATLNTLFGSDAIRAAAVLAGQGTQGFNDLSAALNKTSAADVAAARLDNTAGKIEQMKGQLETASIQIGTALLPALLQTVRVVSQLAAGFSNLSPTTQKTIITIVQVVAALLLIFAAVTKVIAIVKAVQVAWIALNASFLFSPIGLIIIAIIALVAVFVILWVKFSWFRNFWIGTWNVIWGVLKAIGSWFAGPFANFFVKTWQVIWNFFKTIGAWFAGPFSNFFKALWGYIQPVLNGIWVGVKFLWDILVAGIQFVWGIFKSVFNFFAPLIGATFGLIVDIIKTAWSIVSALFQVGLTVWSAIFGAIRDVIVGIWNFTWGVISAVVQAVWGFIEPYVTATWNRIVSNITAVINFFQAVWSAAWNATKAVLQAVWGFIEPYIVGTLIRIQAIMNAVIGWLRSAWDTVWGFIKSTTSAAWDFVVGLFSAAVQRVTDNINRIRALLARVREFFDGLKQAASGGVGSLIDYVSQIPGKIASALGGLASRLYNAGINLIQSLINGIKDKASAVYDVVEGVVSKVRNLLPFSPAKEGPLSGRGYTLYSGQALAEGFAEGIAGKARLAVEAAARMIAEVSATTNLTQVLGTPALTGSTPGTATVAAPRVSVAPQIKVYAVLGDEVREVARTTISEEPDLVAGSANAGNQKRNFLAPGRAK
jgi:TP901 family phage tail tape measure protein